MSAAGTDYQVRLAAFAFLEQQTQLHGDTLSWSVLTKEFRFAGQRVPLLGASGIWKPAVLPRVPLSVTTAPPRPGRPAPYEDSFQGEHILKYRYRGTDPSHRDNVGLQLAMRQRTPLIYFHGVVRGYYVPAWPVYIVGDDPKNLCVTIEVDDRKLALDGASVVSEDDPSGRRGYATILATRRIHQAAFRTRVLRAYKEKCAICRLKHTELLEAAHIIPDSDPRGKPIVPNGISLCKLHHAAFDRHILGVTPDFVVELRRDILDEEDGPMLLYGLQGFQGERLHVPRPEELRPNRAFLEERYSLFVKAG